MKRRIIALALALAFPLILALTVSAFAAEFRIAGYNPALRFNGNTAICSATCRASNSDDEIEATLTLYQGVEYVDSWSDSGTFSVVISESCKVESGKYYRLVLEYSINGESKNPVSVGGTCP